MFYKINFVDFQTTLRNYTAQIGNVDNNFTRKGYLSDDFFK